MSGKKLVFFKASLVRCSHLCSQETFSLPSPHPYPEPFNGHLTTWTTDATIALHPAYLMAERPDFLSM